MGRGPSIENRKGAEDSRRAKLFTKLIREVTVAARSGSDPAGNARLRMAIDKALSSNMSKDTIERAVKRGSGDLAGAHLEEVRYEGYGPGGVAVLVECMTDNSTRTVSEVRHAFTKFSGHLGAAGSVSYLFQRFGVIAFDTGGDVKLGERILEAALEAGADDVLSPENTRAEVITKPDDLEKVRQALTAAGLKPAQADITLRPGIRVPVAGDQAETVRDLLHRLEELDDVQHVHTNAELPAGA